jgi:hypothetical protein
MPFQNLAMNTPARNDRLTRSDARSDDRTREIAFRDSAVIIARRIAGIAMRLRVPLASYQGVTLCLAAEGHGEALHKLELLHHDPDLSIPLCEASDAAEIAVEWAEWAESLGLPRLVERAAGQLELVAPSPATSPEPRRRGSAVAKRRTRFSRRRKMGTLQRLAVIYRDEREIVCYE